MMKKRVFCALLCAVLLAGLIPTALTASAAAAEGDWTTYRFASEYCDEFCDCDGEEHYFRPEAGYKYTDEGFAVIPADYRGTTPQLSVVSKEAKPVKEGIYLQFRVDDFPYENGVGADEWISLTLTTEGKVEPGAVTYGGGWMTLVLGEGDGEARFMPHLTDPETEDFMGSFNLLYGPLLGL